MRKFLSLIIGLFCMVILAGCCQQTACHKGNDLPRNSWTQKDAYYQDYYGS